MTPHFYESQGINKRRHIEKIKMPFTFNINVSIYSWLIEKTRYAIAISWAVTHIERVSRFDSTLLFEMIHGLTKDILSIIWL